MTPITTRNIRNKLHTWVAVYVSITVVLFAPMLGAAQEPQGQHDEEAIEAAAEIAQEAAEAAEELIEAEAEKPCTSGCAQGSDQGGNLGGPSFEDLGGTYDEEGNKVWPEGVEDARQGAGQGDQYGKANGSGGTDVTATNSNTGAGSTNTDKVTSDTGKDTAISNTAKDTSTVGATANTGGNSNSTNTQTGATKTGNANIGVTQVKNDNTAVQGGTAGVSVSGKQGDQVGDLAVDFNNAVSLLAGNGSGKSIQAVNQGTGSDSTNEVILSFNDISNTEVQNDGKIDNTVDVAAITGQNDASKNTSGGSITTGDANIAATLVNLLNTTVLNGNLTVSVQDIFGNLTGNISIPDLAQLASLLSGGGQISVEAENETTGEGSDNTIDVTVNDEEKTDIKNDAKIDTNVEATAITGQNEANKNTGGGFIDTGDASVTASNVTVANTTVEGGNWALVVVNALNKWVGFLIGDGGQVKALSQNETIREIEARNENTGSDSTNSIEITDTTEKNTKVKNDATINNNVTATAITGQNTANKNTGAGDIKTGDANILATAVNIANTTVKNANLGIAVINIFGDWIGDLLYGGSSLLAGASPTSVDLEAENNTTGANSNNEVNVEVNRDHETTVDNNADVDTTLSATIDTGNNTTNKNTSGGDIETGKGNLALHARTIANLTALLGNNSASFDIEADNDTTGVNSDNTIKAKVNNKRVVTVNNDANVSTIIPGLVNTGNNQASDNTLGGDIETGGIDANIAVDNMINKVLLALGDGFTAVDASGSAELTNKVTGGSSKNTNDIETTRELLSNIFNDAIVDTLIDLLFNTGGNESNRNTAPTSKALSQASVEGDGDLSPTPAPVFAVAAVPEPVADTPTTADPQPGTPQVAGSQGSGDQSAVSNPTVTSVPVGGGAAAAVATPAPLRQPIPVRAASPITPALAIAFQPPVAQPRLSAVSPTLAPAVNPTASVQTNPEVESAPEPDAPAASSNTWPAVAVVGSIAGLGAGGVLVRRRLVG